MNRRQFFERTGRWASGGLLALLGGYLVLEGGIKPPASCSENAFCRQCSKFTSCPIPHDFSRERPGSQKKQPYGK